MQTVKDIFYPALTAYIGQIVAEVDLIPEERKVLLRQLASYIRNKMDQGERVTLNFIWSLASTAISWAGATQAAASSCKGAIRVSGTNMPPKGPKCPVASGSVVWVVSALAMGGEVQRSPPRNQERRPDADGERNRRATRFP